MQVNVLGSKTRSLVSQLWYREKVFVNVMQSLYGNMKGDVMDYQKLNIASPLLDFVHGDLLIYTMILCQAAAARGAVMPAVMPTASQAWPPHCIMLRTRPAVYLWCLEQFGPNPSEVSTPMLNLRTNRSSRVSCGGEDGKSRVKT